MSTAETEQSDVDALFEQAQKLSPTERLELGKRILGSVPVTPGGDQEEAMAATVERRWNEIVKGTVKTIPGEQVMEEIRKKLDR